MDIRQLENFLAVFDELSFAKAAEKRYITRQAIRKSITALETEGDTLLFHVDHNRIAPTEDTKKLERKIRPIVKAFLKAEKEYARTKKRDDPIRIVADQSLYPLGIQLFQPFLQDFHNQHPEIALTMEGKSCLELKRMLKAGEFDFGVMVDFPNQPGMETAAVFPSGKLKLFLTVQMKGTLGKETDLGFLNQKRFLLPGTPEEYYWIRKLLDICRERGIDTSRFEYNVPADKMVYLVRFEEAIGFGGASDPMTAPPGTTSVLIPEFEFAPSLCVFRKKDGRETENMYAFVSYLKSAPWNGY